MTTKTSITDACRGLLLLGAFACGSRQRDPPPPPAQLATVIDSGFATAPESAWVTVHGPTLIAFHPVVPRDSLERDEGLATALGDLSYHVGTAMDSLVAAGFSVHYRGGDTIWMRTRNGRSRVVRAADSATLGYLFADSLGRRAVVYGVRGYTELVQYAHEFKRTGALRSSSLR